MNKRQNFILISAIIFFFSGSLVFCQSSSAKISFTKKEIAFFKWGSGFNFFKWLRGDIEVGKKIITREEEEKSDKSFDKQTGLPWPTPVLSEEEKKEIMNFWGPTMLALDGSDNIYLSDSVNKRIIFVSADGSERHPIQGVWCGGYFSVDDMGNVYTRNPDRDAEGFICTRPNGRHDKYNEFKFFEVINGVAYSEKFSSAITIYDNLNNPEKLPPRLIFPKKRLDPNQIGNSFQDSLVIETKKINDHLKKIGKIINADQVEIKLDPRNYDLAQQTHFLGVDDNCNFYLLYRYANIYGHSQGITKEEHIAVYDSLGKKLFELPIPFDYYESFYYDTLIAINIRGDVFQAWESEDGVHIYKWEKQ